MIAGIIDIIVITETKLIDTFPQGQFIIEGYTKPYRIDRSDKGGDIMIIAREDIPSRSILASPFTSDI